MVLFLLSFLFLYGGINYYAFIRADRIFHFPAGMRLFLLIILIILIFTPFFVRLAETRHLEYLAKIMAWAGYLWMAFVFLFFCLSLFFAAVRFTIKLFPFMPTNLPFDNIAFGIAVFLSFILVVYGYFDAQIIRTKKIAITTGQNLSNDGKIRIVQLSDVHIGLIIKDDRLQVLMNKINEAKPDLLVSTGDLLDGELNNVFPLAGLFAQVNPQFGKYAVTGNHEYYAGIARALDFTRQAGFEVLCDEVKEVAGINIVGIDDITGRRAMIVSENSHLTKTMPAIRNDKFVLLLKHQPYVNSADNFNLQLSGHTHGGQIFPFRLITGLFFKNNYGYYELGKNKTLYVSRGAGTWGPPVRIFAPPEITVIDLIGKNAN